MKTVVIFTIIYAWAYAEPQLELYAAGMKGSFIKTLKDGDKICPQDFQRGFTLKCTGNAEDRFGKFYVNGVLAKYDKIAPFFITGRGKRFVKAWKNYPANGKEFAITCLTGSGITRVSLTIGCDQTEDCSYQSDKLSDPPGTLYFRQASSTTPTKVKITSGMTFCPTDVFDSDKITIECKAGSSGMAYFFVNNVKEYIDQSQPFYISEKDGNIPKEWKYPSKGSFNLRVYLTDEKTLISLTNIQISCDSPCKKGNTPSPKISDSPVPNPSVTSTPTSSPLFNPTPTPKLPPGCIIIDAKTSALSTNWTLLDNGVGYRVNDPSMATSEPGRAPLQYSFQVSTNSYYAVVLDFSTNNTFYYNDLWIQMVDPGLGLNLFRNTLVTKDWVKVYHNEYGRAALTWTQGDLFVKRSISSGGLLKPNVNYVFSVSGRSAQVVLHRILLFPCLKTSGINNCQYQKWEASQNRCIPGSYVQRA